MVVNRQWYNAYFWLTYINISFTLQNMIKTFRSKGLLKLYLTGKSKDIGKSYQAKCLRCLDVLEQADELTELNIPGFRFHGLQGKPKRYSMTVSKNYRITFGWDKGAIDIDFEDYH